jgi:PAS domain S-box-containing protein
VQADIEKANEALRESGAMLSDILNSVPQSVFWKDRNGVYLGCNEEFAKAAGLADAGQIVGKTDYDLPWPRHEADAYRADDQEVILKNRPKRHIQEPLQTSDAKRLWIDTTKVPLVDADGKPYGVLGVYEDITERIEMVEAQRHLSEIVSPSFDPEKLRRSPQSRKLLR